MRTRLFVALILVLLLGVPAFGQAQAGYLDVLIVRVKPEKRAEFDAVAKRIADANRRHKGDTWIASETTYGEQNTISFVTPRPSYAEIDKGVEMFMGALNKSYGSAGSARLLQEFNNCIISSRGEVRVRRPDLSRNVPAEISGLYKLVGESRWTRTIMLRVRPGRAGEYVEQARAVKAAFDKAGSRSVVSVSESATGQQGTVFYITTLSSSLGGFDPTGPGLRQAMGDGAYQKYLKTVQEAVLTSESTINRFLPELSNPPEEVVSAAPGFWRPKPAAAPKPKAAEAGKAEAAKKK